ncbi:cobalamin B12-binding domain-containing protein [Micromonospora wenchangensis]|uniref:cobalamin B12-binding domain-containing protein n=1 Tax=Micromonospora wenchangensis TaxID=1185415 RepID=UPI00381E6136
MRLSTANAPVAVLSTIPSDSHTWNLVYLHLLLEEHGFRVVNLGACTPVDELVAAHLRHLPDLVVVSTVNGHGAVEGGQLVRRLRRHDRTTPVVIGGNLGVAGSADGRHVPALLAAGYTGVFVGDRAVDDFRAHLHTLHTRPHLAASPV